MRVVDGNKAIGRDLGRPGVEWTDGCPTRSHDANVNFKPGWACEAALGHDAPLLCAGDGLGTERGRPSLASDVIAGIDREQNDVHVGIRACAATSPGTGQRHGPHVRLFGGPRADRVDQVLNLICATRR